MSLTRKLGFSSLILIVVAAASAGAIVSGSSRTGRGGRTRLVAAASAPPELAILTVPTSSHQATVAPSTTAPAVTPTTSRPATARQATAPRPATNTVPRPVTQNVAPITLPLAPPVTAQSGADASHAGSYVIDRYNADGTPTRFDPCSPIHVVTNLTEAPAGAASMVAAALSKLSAASGLNFVVDGNTDEVPQSGRPTIEARYGSAWAPVLIAWSHHGASDLLPGGSALGEGLGTWLGQGTIGSALPPTFAYVTGEIAIDAQTTARLAPGFGSGQTIGELLLHELGHLVGLGHATDPTQIMYSMLLSVPVAAYGAGDLAGLRRLGASAGCLANAPHPPSA
jgi:hypothetical protein